MRVSTFFFLQDTPFLHYAHFIDYLLTNIAKDWEDYQWEDQRTWYSSVRAIHSGSVYVSDNMYQTI